MKIRLIGAIIVLLILGVLFVATSTESQTPTVQQLKTPSDNSFKDLKIN